MSYFDEHGNRRRDYCDSTYDCDHFNDCPEFGEAARAARPCRPVVPDGWCMEHSTGAGPVYCAKVSTDA